MAEITLEQVAQMADQLSPADKRSLVEHLIRQTGPGNADTTPSVASEPGTRPQSLRGIWQGYFPDNFDIDAVLNEIRHEWKQEWPEVFGR
jgi:hypothetical protein